MMVMKFQYIYFNNNCSPKIDNYVWDVYEESVPISTYLVAFVVSDFVNKTSGNFAVWTRADTIKSADYALQIGPKILQYFEEFFYIKYPLPKMDMIALPDFSAGGILSYQFCKNYIKMCVLFIVSMIFVGLAMENWFVILVKQSLKI